MFAGAKLKEVPRKQAEEFTADVAADPKFLRHVRRQQASEEVTRLYLLLDQARREEAARVELAARDALERVRRVRTEAALTYSAAVPAALVAVVIAAIPVLAIRLIVAGAVVATAAYYSTRARAKQRDARNVAERAEADARDRAEEFARGLEVVEARIKDNERVIAECDAEGEKSIRIIDPATFGTPAPRQEKEQQE